VLSIRPRAEFALRFEIIGLRFGPRDDEQSSSFDSGVPPPSLSQE
jgi:hypothetical protein